MRKHIIAIAVIFVLGCQFADTSDDPKAPVAKSLKPSDCFVTPLANDFVIGILGEGWALHFTLPREKGKIPNGLLGVRQASFYRGPDLGRFIRPPAGVPTPPIPKTDAYTNVCVSLTITAVGGSGSPEPNGYLDLTLSDFKVGENVFAIDGKVHVPFRGPYP